MAENKLDGAPEPFFFRHSARQIMFGPGKLAELAAIAKSRNVERAVVVMDGFFIGGPLEARVREILGNLINVEVHGVPIQEPDTETVEACRQALEDAQPDMVVAVGVGMRPGIGKRRRCPQPDRCKTACGNGRHVCVGMGIWAKPRGKW